MHPELSIVIVNWNAGTLLARCVETIVNSAPKIDYEIIVIDNASQDQSLACLLSHPLAARLLPPQQLRIVNNSENRGYGPANNQAFALTSAPFVFLLNPDTEVKAEAIDTLMATMRSDGRIGACAPAMLNRDGSMQISVFHNPPRVWQIVLSNLKLYRLLPRRFRGELLLADHWAHDRKRVVPMVSGAAILARREMIDQVGGFDERFQMYAEDNEWCLRIIRAGWRLMFDPAATVLHHGGQSAAQRWSQPERERVQLEAAYVFQQLVLPRWRLIANQLANYSIVSGQVAWRAMRGTHSLKLDLQKQVYRENFKRALGLRGAAGKQTSS